MGAPPPGTAMLRRSPPIIEEKKNRNKKYKPKIETKTLEKIWWLEGPKEPEALKKAADFFARTI